MDIRDLFGYDEDDAEIDPFIACWDSLEDLEFSGLVARGCNLELERMRGTYDADNENEIDVSDLDEAYQYGFWEIERELKPYRQKNKSSYDIDSGELQDFTYVFVHYLSEFIDELILGGLKIETIDKQGTRMNVEITGL